MKYILNFNQYKNILIVVLVSITIISCNTIDDTDILYNKNIILTESYVKLNIENNINVQDSIFLNFYNKHIITTELVSDTINICTFNSNNEEIYTETCYNKNNMVLDSTIKYHIYDNIPYINLYFKRYIDKCEYTQTLTGNYIHVFTNNHMSTKCTLNINNYMYKSDNDTLIVNCTNINEHIFLFNADNFSSIEYSTPVIGQWDQNNKLYCIGSNIIKAKKIENYFVFFWDGAYSAFFNELKQSNSFSENRDHFILTNKSGQRINIYMDKIEYGKYNYMEKFPYNNKTIIKFDVKKK